MWRSIRRWRDWAMHELAGSARAGSGIGLLSYGYEKPGLSIIDQPIPWNAEMALVRAEIRLMDGPRRKSDFQVRLPDWGAVPPELFRRGEVGGPHQLLFRFRPPGQSVVAELCYREQPLMAFTLPALSREEFLA